MKGGLVLWPIPFSLLINGVKQLERETDRLFLSIERSADSSIPWKTQQTFLNKLH
jgi:hypothetical protein